MVDYRTVSVLTYPIRDQDEKSIAVIQVKYLSFPPKKKFNKYLNSLIREYVFFKSFFLLL